MLPHRGTFFEFVPLEEQGRPTPTRVPLWAVERDRPYAIVVDHGLRPLRVRARRHRALPVSVDPLRIEFVGRLSGCLSVTQELTTHVEIERAVAHAVAQRPAARTVDFGAAADVGVDGTAKSRYVLFVEFQEGAAPADLAAFARRLRRGHLRGEPRLPRAPQRRRRDPAATRRAARAPAARARSSTRSRAETSRGSSPASSTTRRRSTRVASEARERLAMNRIGVAIVGVNGAVASTVIAGVELMKRGLVPRIGMVTERTDAQHRRVDHRAARLRAARELVFARLGPPVRERLRGRAAPQGAAAARARRRCKPSSSAIQPWPAVFSTRYAEKLAGKNVVHAKRLPRGDRDPRAQPRGLQEARTGSTASSW